MKVCRNGGLGLGVGLWGPRERVYGWEERDLGRGMRAGLTRFYHHFCADRTC